MTSRSQLVTRYLPIARTYEEVHIRFFLGDLYSHSLDTGMQGCQFWVFEAETEWLRLKFIRRNICLPSYAPIPEIRYPMSDYVGYMPETCTHGPNSGGLIFFTFKKKTVSYATSV